MPSQAKVNWQAQAAVRVLIHDAAHVARIVGREHAVEHDLRDRDLSAHRLVARLEIDRRGEALLGLRALLAFEAELLRRRERRTRPRQRTSASCGSTTVGVRRLRGFTGLRPAPRRFRPASAILALERGIRDRFLLGLGLDRRLHRQRGQRGFESRIGAGQAERRRRQQRRDRRGADLARRGNIDGTSVRNDLLPGYGPR